MRALAAGLLLLAGHGAARAETTTLPVSRFVVELPSEWRIYRARGSANMDLLRSFEGGNLAVGVAEGTCATFFAQTEAALGTALTSASPRYVPEGWEARSFSSNGTPSYLGCHTTTKGVTLAVQWWTEINSAWQSEMITMLGALDSFRVATGAAAEGNLTLLPGTGLAVQLPTTVRLETGDPSAGRDVISLSTGDTLEVTKSSGCSGSGCITNYVGSFQVTGATTTVEGQAILASIEGETFSADWAAAAKLPESEITAELPVAWVRSARGGADVFTMEAGEIVIRRDDSKCTDILGAAGPAYDPSWIPKGWSAAGDTTVTLCRTVEDDGQIVVTLPRSALVGKYRKQISIALVDINDRADYKAPPEPHKSLLPIALYAAGQTVAHDGNERAYGFRGGARAWTTGGVLALRAEVGWDNVQKLSYDVNLQLGLPVSGGMIVGQFGRDALGTGETESMHSDWYGGVGIRLGSFEEDHAYFLEGSYLWRNRPDEPTDGTMIDDALHPKREIRLRLEIYSHEPSGWFNGLAIDYMTTGTTGILQLGLFTKL